MVSWGGRGHSLQPHVARNPSHPSSPAHALVVRKENHLEFGPHLGENISVRWRLLSRGVGCKRVDLSFPASTFPLPACEENSLLQVIDLHTRHLEGDGESLAGSIAELEKPSFSDECNSVVSWGWNFALIS